MKCVVHIYSTYVVIWWLLWICLGGGKLPSWFASYPLPVTSTSLGAKAILETAAGKRIRSAEFSYCHGPPQLGSPRSAIPRGCFPTLAQFLIRRDCHSIQHATTVARTRRRHFSISLRIIYPYLHWSPKLFQNRWVHAVVYILDVSFFVS